MNQTKINQTKINPITPTKKLPIHPCGHYVLVKPDPTETVSENGIVTMTKGQESREDVARVKGTLVAIGPNAWKAYNQGEPDGVGKPWAELGDHVVIKRHVSDRYVDEDDIVDGKPQVYFLMVDENLLAVLEE